MSSQPRINVNIKHEESDQSAIYQQNRQLLSSGTRKSTKPLSSVYKGLNLELNLETQR